MVIFSRWLALAQLAAFTYAAAAADVQVPLLKVGFIQYTNATLTKMSETHASVSHKGGMAMVKFSELTPELQKQLGYDPKAAEKAKQSMGGPAVLPGAAAPGGEAVWLTTIKEANAKAKESGRCTVIFYDDGASSGASKKLRDAFADPNFVSFAQANLVLLRQRNGEMGPGMWEFLDRSGKSRGYYGLSSDTNTVGSMLKTLNDLTKPPAAK